MEDWTLFDRGHNDDLNASEEAREFAKRQAQAAKMPGACYGQVCGDCIPFDGCTPVEEDEPTSAISDSRDSAE